MPKEPYYALRIDNEVIWGDGPTDGSVYYEINIEPLSNPVKFLQELGFYERGFYENSALYADWWILEI